MEDSVAQIPFAAVQRGPSREDSQYTKGGVSQTLRRLIICGMLLPLPSGADAVTITGGSLAIGSSTFGTINLVGDGFTYSSLVDDAGGVLVCQICLPGPQSAHVFISGADLANHPSASLTFEGVWTVPSMLTTPFTFTSTLNGLALEGMGLATLTLNPLNGVERVGIEYDFAPPASVPEPTTWLLLGTGFVGLAFARRKFAP